MSAGESTPSYLSPGLILKAQAAKRGQPDSMMRLTNMPTDDVLAMKNYVNALMLEKVVIPVSEKV